jgi:hypothetical protein
MADEVTFLERTDPLRPGAFYVKGTDALKPRRCARDI